MSGRSPGSTAVSVCRPPARFRPRALYSWCFARHDAHGGQRLIGWEDASVGKHGVGLLANADGSVHAAVRRDGASGDVQAPATGNDEFQLVELSWGPQGIALAGAASRS